MTSTQTSSLQLFWVERDPDRERAVDALGLGAQSDRIADSLLPGISVSTRRVRYLSFFCWVLQKTEGERFRVHAIHEFEARLAIREARTHASAEVDVCRNIVGRQRAWTYYEHRGEWPTSPTALYKNMAFDDYRPLMRQLGLIATGSRFELTDTGKHLGKLYGSASHGQPQCLSEISTLERGQVSGLLGLDFRVRAPDNAYADRRRATYVELDRRWVGIANGEISPGAVLTTYAKARRPAPTASYLLHRAFVWEAISLGLTTTFAMLLSQARSSRPDVQRVVGALKGARKCRASCEDLAPIDLDDNDTAAKAVVAWLRKARELEPEGLSLERNAIDIVNLLVREHDERRFVDALLERHASKKLGDAWIASHNGTLRITAPKKNLDLRPAPRTYRLDAFAQMLADLRGAS